MRRRRVVSLEYFRKQALPVIRSLMCVMTPSAYALVKGQHSGVNHMSNAQANTQAKTEEAAPAPASEATHTGAECQMISEKQFMRDHTYYSAISSWLFAIAGATNIGVLCAFSSKVLMAAEQGKPFFKSSDPKVVPVFGNKLYNRIALGMTAFGAVCMAVSNWLESKKVVTEWQLGAGKLQRKANIAEKELEQMELSHAPATAADQAINDNKPMPAKPCKNWAASVQAKPAEAVSLKA